MFLVRRIPLAKWPKTYTEAAAGRISADAITADLRTSGNCLSFWTCDRDDQIESVALAIAAAADRLDRIDVVWIEDEERRFSRYRRLSTPGETPVAEWRTRHLDIAGLDHEGLGVVALAVARSIAAKRCRRLPALRVKERLADAVSDGALSLDALDPRIRDKVQATVERREEPLS